MPLFACTKCRAVENTACGDYWMNAGRGKPVLCSECSPLIGKWHGRFPKESADNGNWEPEPQKPHFLQRRHANEQGGHADAEEK